VKLAYRVLVISVSKVGANLGEEIAGYLGAEGHEAVHFCRAEYAEGDQSRVPYSGQASEVIRSNYHKFDAIVAVMALGGVVRIIAPLLQDKFDDPAVVTTDDSGRYVVSLLSGHFGGANDLAKLVAKCTGGTSVVTTATEALGKVSLEEVARALRCSLMNREAVVPVNAAIVNGKRVACVLVANSRRPSASLGGIEVLHADSAQEAIRASEEFGAAMVVSKEPIPLSRPAVAWLRPLSTIVGLGSVRGVEEETVASAIREALSRAGLDASEIDRVVSIKDEPGMAGACGRLGMEFTTIEPQTIASFRHPELSPVSEMAMKAYGVPGVAEPAALWLAGRGAHLLLGKMAFDRKVTVAIAQGPGRGAKGRLYLAGVGPGSPLCITYAAERAVSSADVVAGYPLPLSVVNHLLDGKMRVEFSYKRQAEGLETVARCLEEGDDVCFVFTGDSTFSESELVERLRRLGDKVEMIPGISSIQVAAARSGVPLDKARVVTFHVSGDLESAKRTLLEGLRESRPAVVIPRPWDFMPREIADYLVANGVSAELPASVYERLTHRDEAVTTGTLGTLRDGSKTFSDLTVMVVGKYGQASPGPRGAAESIEQGTGRDV